MRAGVAVDIDVVRAPLPPIIVVHIHVVRARRRGHAEDDVLHVRTGHRAGTDTLVHVKLAATLTPMAEVDHPSVMRELEVDVVIGVHGPGEGRPQVTVTDAVAVVTDHAGDAVGRVHALKTRIDHAAAGGGGGGAFRG